MEKQYESSWTGVHEYFWLEEYDAGASQSHQKEAYVESESTPQYIEGAKTDL